MKRADLVKGATITPKKTFTINAWVFNERYNGNTTLGDDFNILPVTFKSDDSIIVINKKDTGFVLFYEGKDIILLYRDIKANFVMGDNPINREI